MRVAQKLQKKRHKNAAKEKKKKKNRVISHLASASPWNKLDLTLKNNEIWRA